MDEIRELVEAGHLTPVIDSSYPPAEAAAAVQQVEQASPGGKITVVVQ
jgi:NADPH:quinone reductase-like Zn-dependent oxidoreductase